MILLKTAWADFRKNLPMNLFIILQVAVSLIITAVMISTISIRSQYYTPFRDLFTSNGLFFKFDTQLSWNPDELLSNEYLDKEDVLEICSDADHVYSCYTMFGPVEDSIDWSGYELITYDDAFLERYQPDLVAGRWLDITTDPEQIEVVVSENDNGVEVGDVLTLTAYSYPENVTFTATVVGVFQEGAKIVGSANLGTDSVNFNNFYYSFSHELEGKMEILASHTAMENITGDFELLDDEIGYVIQPMTSSMIITYPDDVSAEQIEADRQEMLQYGIGTSATLDELHENSITYLLEEAKMFFPIIIILFLLTSISSISTSALITRKNLKNYALYYITGLGWKRCAVVNLLHSIFSFVLAVILAFAALLLIPYTPLASSVEIIWSGYIVLAFAVLILLEMVISMIMPLSIIGKNTPKQILTR